MAGFNRTLSPQGDGNVRTIREGDRKFSLCSTEPFPRKGTETQKTSIAEQPEFLRSTEPFPRKGTETHKEAICTILFLVPVQQNPFPARGRKRSTRFALNTLSTQVQQNPFPARGRKLNFSITGDELIFFTVQQNPFPARGRKLQRGVVEELFDIQLCVQQNPFPARGRKHNGVVSF